jgi:hypothetical protein
MIDFLNSLWGALTGQFRFRVSLEAENLVLRDQLDVLSRKPRPCAGFQSGSTARLCNIFNSLN